MSTELNHYLKSLRDRGVTFRLGDGELKFLAPKGVVDSEMLHELRIRKQEIIEFLAARPVDSVQAAAAAFRIRVAERPPHLPLSYSQERLWFLEQLDLVKSAYHVPGMVRLNGELDDAALERSLMTIVARHESLRTRFEEFEGRGVQRIVGTADAFRLQREDFSDLPESKRAAAAERLTNYALEEPFDLRAGPLLRVRLIRLAQQEHLLLLTMHHIVCDGWSVGVLVRELSELYAAYTEDRESPLAPLPIQYADYALWQREWLKGDVLDSQLLYWKERLAGAPAALTLPTDHARPAVASHRGSNLPFALSEPTTKRLNAVARREGATLFMVLLGAFQFALSRWSGQNDIVVGGPITGRRQKELDGLIGFFVSTLVFRTDLSGRPTFLELLARVKETALGAYAHQDVPFEKLVEFLQPERDLGRHPIFQTWLVVEGAGQGVGEFRLPRLEVRGIPVKQTGAKFDLYLSLRETRDGLVGTLDFTTDLFERTTMERFARGLERVLDQIAVHPHWRLSEFTMLSDFEREQQLVRWNATTQAVVNATLPQLLEGHSRRCGGTTALRFGDESLEYAELMARANRLAHHLIGLGVGPERRVALALPRSFDLVVAMLAIVKAGAAYIPIDTDYPPERIAYMLSDSEPVCVVTHAPLLDSLSPSGDCPVLCLDDAVLLASISALPETDPTDAQRTTPLLAQHPAYMIYTSGSTGRPKGVINTHAGIVNRLQWMQATYRLGPADRVLQKTPISFDVSVWEFFWPLLQGATLVLARPEGHKDPDYIGEIIARESITIAHFVPAMLDEFLREPRAHQCISLRAVICSGEALTRATQRRFQEVAGAALHNLYGPTEAAVDVTAWACSPDDDTRDAPIGRPIWNTQMRVLDRDLQLLPTGAFGELYIAGTGLARGYAAQPGLTADRFMADPFGAPGSRMYRTGDLARWRAEGTLEYLGRADTQIKLRGFRVELGEIEVALASHSGISQACVALRKDRGDARLVAYLIARDDPPMPGELREYLARQLPEYMLPSAFVFVSVLPVSPSGKLDRNALPEPDAKSFVSREYETPEGAAEAAIAEIWSLLLAVERVGRHDNFFELGGHSLLAIRFVKHMREQGFKVAARDLFTAPTLEQLAARAQPYVEEILPNAEQIPHDAVEITPQMLPLTQLTPTDIERIVEATPGGVGNIKDVYPLTPLQEGILFHNLVAADGDPYVLTNLFAFRSRERMQAHLDALQVVMDRHDILRTALMWQGLPEPVQIVWRRARMPVEEITIDDNQDATEQLLRIGNPATYRMDLRRAPLMRAFVARDFKSGRWLVLLAVHHAIADHTTVEMLQLEIRHTLDGTLAQLPPPLPFRTLVARTRDSSRRLQQESFFSRLLGDVSEPTAPYGVLEVHDGVGSTRTVEHALEATDAARLRDRARQRGLSAASLFHLAWALVLARLSNTEDVVFGTVLFGRLHGEIGIERILGPVINTLPVRVAVSMASVDQGWRQTHDLLAELVEHDDAPLILAQRCSGIPAPQPLFYALLNFRYGGMLTTQADVRFDEVELLSVGQSTNYPLVLCVDDLGSGYDLTVSAQGGIDPARVCSYLAQALHLLIDALDRQEPIGLRDIDVIPMEESVALRAPGLARRKHSDTRCVHHWFEAQVDATPCAIAVVDGDRRLSYAEINARANRLAHRLRRLGVKAEDRVAICMDRSAELIVALLGTVKAGAAYVPLDPAYPTERLVNMLTDCRPAAVLTQSDLGDNWSEALAQLSPDTSILQVTNGASAWDDESSQKLDGAIVGVHPRSLLYIIYTSGSTGAPKGVTVEHANLTRLFSATAGLFGFGQDDVWTFFHSIAFDFSVWEIWGALLYGGSIVIVPRDVTRSTDDFHRLLCRERVTVLNQTPSAFRQLIAEQARADGRHNLRHVILGGEALDARMLAPWYADERNSATALVNMYGITETTVHVTYRPLSQADSSCHGASQIGTPIEDLSLHILDANGRVAPTGVVGEIFVGGAGVARGYLNRAELTAARFLRDHLGDNPNARLYKTGDLGRRRDDGEIEYLGRNDAQVQIRGFRIELGEIESALASHPGVQNAVVIVRETSQGNKRLHAYYVPHTAADSVSVSSYDLRRHVVACLPDYMLPASLIRLERLPLTPNGKLDRQALPAADARAHASTDYIAPVGKIEIALAEIWQSLLGVGVIGRRDNFFELGGHSLLAMQVTSRVRDRLGVEIGLRDIFLHPVLEELAAMVAEAAPSTLPDIVPLRYEGDVALSFAQQRMWFLAEFETDSTTYHISSAFRLRGVLDRRALQAALDGLLARHDILRTTFPARDGEPVQRVIPVGAAFALEQHDLRQCADAEVELERILQEEGAAPFDLTEGPLIRARLVRLGDNEHVMIVTMHHIVSDGWSMQILIDDFSRLYALARDVAAPKLVAPALQYADFATWQRVWINGEMLQRQADYWRNMFSVPPPFLELPTDRHRPAQQDYRGERIPYQIDRELTVRLKQAARAQGVSLYALLFAGWAALLARLSGQDDIVIGTPSANRGRRELEDVVGFFVNTLAVRVDFDGRACVQEFVTHVQARLLDAQQHQDIPFEQVIEVVRPPRSLAHTPLFQAMMTWRNAVARPLDIEGLEVAALEIGTNGTAKFDVSLSLGEAGDEIVGELEYATALYDARTIGRYLTYFGNLLTAMVGDPDLSLATLDLLPPAERHTLLSEWTGVLQPAERRTLPDLIETCTSSHGAATALRFGVSTLSYAQLGARANRLAHHLIALGVGPESRVALALPRSFDLVVAMLAIAKSGAAYVSIDTTYPLERITYMLRDSAPACIVTHTGVVASSQHREGCGVLCLDDPELQTLLALRPRSNPSDLDRTTPLLPLHPAYVIYTSGSTGQPKGAIISQRALVNHMQWMAEAYPLTPMDVVLQKTSLSFDASVWEVWAPLLAGAQLLLAEPEIEKDVELLARACAQGGVTRLQVVPSMLRQLIDAPDLAACTALKDVFSGGEPLTAALRDGLASRTPVALHNLYGPTETCIQTVVHTVTADDVDPVPIGRPIWNTAVRVLDRDLQLLPVGSVGELYVAGTCLARGYVGQAGLTAERFIADPFGSPGTRLYRTGDRARWRADGKLEYLGRVDMQIKLLGVRIEPGEIEAVLTSHANIDQACVMLRQSGGEARLAAYLIAHQREPAPTELREHLARHLPSYMLPAAFVYVPSFPEFPNGKLDYKQLPEPKLPSCSGRAPRTPQERILCDLFADVLGLADIGIHDSFFELGGHSLLATRLISRVRGALGTELAVRTLFEASTVAALAVHLTLGSRPRPVPMPAARRPLRIPLSFAQRRLWFVDRLQGPSASYTVPLAVRLTGTLDVAALRDAMHDLVVRHEVLRTVYDEYAGVPHQRILAAEESQVPFEHVVCEAEALAGEAARRERESTFDLARDLPLRVWLYRIGEAEHVLLVLVHHIAADASSVAPLVRDLATFYAARRSGLPPESTLLILQYADYVLWQRDALGEESDPTSLVAAQLSYWRDALVGLPMQTRLPFDRPHPAVWSGKGDSIALDIPASMHERLRLLHRSTQTTMFMLLQAAVAVLLCRTGSGSDIVLGTSIAGRSDEALDDLVGCFANLLVLRVQVDDNPTFSDLLRSVREVNLDAQQHQDLPFERLVELLQPLRTLASHPLFQVAVVMEDDNRGSLDVTLPGLAASPVALGSTAAKYDLQFSFAERFESGEPDGIRASVIFACDLFNAATVATLMQRLLAVLYAVSSDGALRVRAIDIMTTEEKSEILSAGIA